jgi:serine/threonine-protein kinase
VKTGIRRLASPTTALTEEERAFLQKRVAGFGLAVGLLFAGFLLFRLGFGYYDASPVEPSVLWHAAGAGAFLAAWLACSRGQRSVRFIRAAEAIALLAGCGAMELMAMSIPHIARPDFILLLSLTLALVARAIYVPSSGRRTLIFGVLIGLDTVGTIYFHYRTINIAAWRPLDPSLASMTSNEMAAMIAGIGAAWWTATTIVTTAASRIIYGLRREVRTLEQLGQYRLESKLGEGGMGTVYRASHAMLRRPCAIKLLPLERAGEANVQRFEREVQLTASLAHPNTVTVFDYGRTPEGVFYYAMELIHGKTLEDVVRASGPMPPARALAIIDQVAGALVEAHGIGLIHRDLKPANIMLHMLHDQGGVGEIAKVLDFGLVKQVAGAEAIGLTNAGTITGTPLYMPPEAITAPDTVDARSDLYALGATAYFAVTGTDVFNGNTVVELCSKHLNEAPEPPTARLGAHVPDDLEQLILACLRKAPAERPQTAREVQQRARACADYGAWGAAEAEAWWRANGRAIEPAGGDDVDAMAATALGAATE